MRITDILIIFLIFALIGGWGVFHLTNLLIQVLLLVLVIALILRVVQALSGRNGL